MATQTMAAKRPILALLVGTLSAVAYAQEVGPARGALVVSGGGETTDHIIDRFIELAGGPDASILVVPTSGRNDEDYHEFYPGLRRWREAGAENVSVLHTRDREVANTDAFVEPLRKARGVWFNGGSHWLHTDAYLDTKVHEELFALLDRGGVIGGGSAGAHVQGEIMNVSRSPEREFSERKLPQEDWRRGFGFLRGVIIDDDQRQIPPDPPETFRTVGGLFYFLRPGDRYDLMTREATRPGRTQRPIDRVAPRKGRNQNPRKSP